MVETRLTNSAHRSLIVVIERYLHPRDTSLPSVYVTTLFTQPLVLTTTIARSFSLRSAHLSPRLQWSSRIDRACDLCRAATKKPRYFARITTMACPSLSIIRQPVRYVPARGTAVTGSLQLGVPMHAPPCAPTCTLAAPAYSLPLKPDPPYHR